VNEFENHVAKYEKHSEHLETLEWKKPDSNIYAIWYVRQYGTLMVFGDCYEATYQWNYQKNLDLNWIAGLNSGYFISKCRASPHGRDPRVWNIQKAEEQLREYFDEFKDVETYPPHEFKDEAKERAEEAKKFDDASGWRYLGDSEFEWNYWLRENAYDVFGEEWYEGILGNLGKVLGPCIPLHLEGLKAAMQQVREKEGNK
jgi:hypothetical protein